VTASLLVTAPDPELPAMLRSAFQRVTFTTAERLRAVLPIKPGSMVILLDEGQSDLLTGLRRNDVRAVAVVTPRAIPVIFRRPVVTVVERPLVALHVVAAIERALADFASEQGSGQPPG
jgi:hypothetical protein